MTPFVVTPFVVTPFVVTPFVVPRSTLSQLEASAGSACGCPIPDQLPIPD